MMIRRMVVLLLCVALGGAASARDAKPPSGAGDRNEASIREDARLDAPISLARADAPVGEVLKELGRRTGVRLTASPDVSQDRVTLYLKDQPVETVMGLLARHLDFQWYRDGTGYELAQNGASRRREQALRDAERAAQVGAIQARMERLLRLADLPRERLEARENEVVGRLGAADLPAGERDALAEERDAIRDLLRPGAAPALALFRALNPAQRGRVWAGAMLWFSTADGTLPQALLAQVQAAQEAMRNSRQVLTFSAGPAGRPGGGPAPVDEYAPPNHADAVIRVTEGEGGVILASRGGPGALPERRLRLEFAMAAIHEREGSRRVLPITWSPRIVPPARSAPLETATEDPVLLRSVKLDLEPARPAAPGADGGVLVRGGSLPSGHVRLSEVAAKLAEASGLEVVSDSFIRARIDPRRLSGSMPVVRILDTLANELEYAWEKEGNRILLRSRTYYRDRPMEVPERVLGPWRERIARAAPGGRPPTLDDLAELALALTDPQARGLQDYWSWYFEGTPILPPSGRGSFYGNRHHLRLWAQLAPAQRQAALAGTILPVRTMNRLQQRAFLTALTAPPEGLWGPGELRRPPTAAEVAAGGFSLRAAEATQQVYTGTGPGGEESRFVVLGPGGSGAPGGPPPTLTSPGGGPVNLQPSGPPARLDSYNFSYHLADNPVPARSAMLMIPRSW